MFSFVVHSAYVVALLIASMAQKIYRDSAGAAILLPLVVVIFGLTYWRLYKATGDAKGRLSFVNAKTRESFLRGVQASAVLFVVLVVLLVTKL